MPADLSPAERFRLIDRLRLATRSPYQPLMNEAADAIEALSAARAEGPGGGEDESAEMYELGKRDGYEQAVQDIDQRTGGDGEYRFCIDGDPDRHTPDAPSMIARIADRFAALSPVMVEGLGLASLDESAATRVPSRAASEAEQAGWRDISDDDAERCIACAIPFKNGDRVLDDASGGAIHAACCGPERESYTGADGGPLKDGEPIPEGYTWGPL